MKILKSIITLIMLLTVQPGLAADSTAFQLDTVTTSTSPIVDSLPVNWDAEWIGGNPDALVSITDNGAEVNWVSGQGAFVWIPETSGEHTLRYTTYIDGVSQEEVYTATFRSNWGSVSSMFEWVVTNNEVTITKYIGTNTVVNIPSAIDGYPVTAIGDLAFSENEFLEEVTIPIGVKHIGERAFHGCRSLRAVNGGGGLEWVGVNAFDETLFIYNVDSWDDVHDNEDYSNGYGLDLVYVGNFIVGVRGRLEEAYFGNLLSSGVWHYSLDIPDGTTGMADGVFRGLPITSVSIPGSVKIIPKGAFEDCPFINELYLAEGIEEIKEYAFECAGDYNQELREGICRLERLSIPSSVRKIDAYAFRQFANLKYVTGLDDIDDIHELAFAYTPYLNGWLSSYLIIENNVVMGLGSELRFDDGCIVDGVLNIPEGITNIADRAFYESGEFKEVILPSTLLTIGNNAFAFCGLVEVSIPEGVTDIGDWAFWMCDLLEKVSIPNSVTNIGQRAFCWCESLEEVAIPESVASIGDRAFAFCHSMTNITFLGDSPVMGEDVFGAEDEVEDMICTAYVHRGSIGWGVEIPGKWNGIDIDYIDENGGYAPVDDFEWDVTVCGVEITRYVGTATQVNIPPVIDNLPVISIGYEAFADREDIETVKIPDTVQEIKAGSFWWCTGIKQITIPKSVSYIDSEAFDYCSGLETFEVSDDNDYYKSENGVLLTKDGKILVSGVNGDVDIPAGVEKVDYSAFYGRTNLCSVVMPDTLVTIDEFAFGDCLSLKEINLPASVTNVVTYAFSGCGVRSFAVELGNPQYKSDSGLLLTKDGAIVVCGINGSVDIPSGVVEIAEGAFDCYPELFNVSFPDDLERIGSFAFSWCLTLSNVTLPEKVTNIGDEVFGGCSSLTNVTFFGDAPEMGERVFMDYINGDVLDCTAYVYYGSTGWGVDIPGVWNGIRIEYLEGNLDDGVDEIDGYVWKYRPIGDEKKVEIVGVEPEPQGDIAIPPRLDGKTVTSIGAHAFAYCDDLYYVDIPSSICNIGDGAFLSCCEMEAIFLPNMLTNIGVRAFYDCGYIEHAYIPFGVRSIGDEAFAANLNLERVSLPSSVSYMGSGIFAYCDNLSEVDLAEGLSEIGDKMFYECCSLVAVEVPDGCREIGESAFACCEELLMVSIPNSVTRLGDPICEVGDVFLGCESLSFVIFVDRTNSLTVEPCALPAGVSVIVNREGYGFVNWRDASKDVWAPVDDPFRMEEPVRVVPVWSSVNEPGADWVTSKASAEAKALAEGKRILLVAGRSASLNTLYLKNTLCADSELYERLKHDFVLWYCDADAQRDEVADYATQYVLPLVCIIDPTDMSNAIGVLSGWTDYDRFVEFLDEYGVWKPIDDIVVPDGYSTYNDGKYIWLWEYCDGGAALVGYYSLITNDTGYVCGQYSRGVFPEPIGHIDVPAYVYPSDVGGDCEGHSQGLPVVILDEGLFCNCTNITSVTLPETLRWIGDSVFENTSITSLLVPDGLQEIGSYAFAYSLLKEINVPREFQYINSRAFDGTPWLEAQGDFAVYGDFLLAYQGDDADVEIPETVRVVCDGAFDSTFVESVHIPDSVTDIESYAFSYAENLLTVTGGANVQYVGYDSFYNTALWENSPLDSPVRAGTMVVGFKGDLSDVLIIPDGVTIIGNNAFCGCTNITSVTLPASVKAINDWAFAYCENLEDVVFLGTRDDIDMNVFSAFDGTPWLANKAFEPPENDDFANAATLQGKSGNISATNLGATSESAESGFNLGSATIWWKWTAPTSGIVTFDTLGSCFDTKIGVCTKTDDEILLIDVNDDADNETYQSRIAFSAEVGSEYYIVVSGYSNAMGDVVLNWEITEPPPNDYIENAIILTSKSGNILATNLGATREPTEEDLGLGSATIWWKLESSENLKMMFDTFGSDIDTMLGVYAYENGSFVEVAYNDDCDEMDTYQSRVSFDAVRGITYYIVVSGYNTEMGDIVLNWSTLSDAIPELLLTATGAEVSAALEGSADVKLAANIKTAVEYEAYRTWALGLTGVTPDAVKASPNAWLSYALNTATLIAAAPKEGDIVIDTFESTATDGAFEFAVKIDGIAVGDDALEANIRKVFDIEGSEKLVSDGVGELGVGFSPDNVEVNAAAPENGNVKFTVTPKTGNGELGTGNGEKPKSFFFRVKMK